MRYIAVIPTAHEKHPWLQRTLFGLDSQSIPPEKVLIGYDLKPGQSPVHPSYDTHLHIEVIPFSFSDHWKHQHEIINRLVKEYTYSSDLLLIMDDDYWLTHVNIMKSLLERYRTSSLTFAQSYFQIFKTFPQCRPEVKGERICFFQEEPEKSWFSTLEERGHHNPMCGHPKLIHSWDFSEVGGFDIQSFKHYWWCDTDLFYRLRERLIMIPVTTEEILHVNHPRKNLLAFADRNEEVLKVRYPQSSMPSIREVLPTEQFEIL